MPIFAFAIFLSAFLLFQVQPVIARYILPWYGGSPAVWTTCLLFFQVGLLGGYAYAHALVTFLRKHPPMQYGIHLGLLVVALFLLPITPDDSLKPTGAESSPVKGILLLLASSVGFPYLLLSASGPLLQHWFGSAFPGKSPYRLYSISNLGSMLGLLTYPFLFEPLLPVTKQTLLWSLGFVIYSFAAAACGLSYFRSARAAKTDPTEGDDSAKDSPAPSWRDWALWISFAACGSMLLLSLTNQMCQDVAVVPFLWVAPLSLYLLTFVICFDHERWYQRWFWIPLAAGSVAAVVYLINQQFADGEIHLGWQLTIYLSAIFLCCLVCHGEVVRTKPSPRYLTGFYLAISLGGAIGGIFVSLIAPMIFEGYWELHFALILLVVLSALTLFRFHSRFPKRIFVPIWAALSIAALGGLQYGLVKHLKDTREGSLAASRGFYGVLRVYEMNTLTPDVFKALYHGRISHGRQYLTKQFRKLATTYYSLESGIGAAFATHPAKIKSSDENLHVGVVGLGVGTLATYANSGDRFRFYEINPQVEEMARDHFTYLEDCKGDEQVVIGDARISLEKEFREGESQNFDILVVDAFSGDSIPIHLMTKEAFELYLKHLKPDGTLAVHISNLHLELSDPVRTICEDLGLHASRVAHDPEDDNYHSYYSDWILISRDPGLEDDLFDKGFLSEWDEPEAKEILWTDDYCNLLQVVVW
ncbi:MAG: fused MFS/spermidine synthase [Verrucomicrobiales bacterium]|nr:fused MFS/spermidine synthase [Verrucomicrobiales bacterium]